jgi:hypothetical protein
MGRELAAQLGLHRLGGAGGGLGERDDRVAVLAGIVGELGGIERAGAPALVKRVAQNVEAGAHGVEAVDDGHGGCSSGSGCESSTQSARRTRGAARPTSNLVRQIDEDLAPRHGQLYLPQLR